MPSPRSEVAQGPAFSGGRAIENYIVPEDSDEYDGLPPSKPERAALGGVNVRSLRGMVDEFTMFIGRLEKMQAEEKRLQAYSKRTGLELLLRTADDLYAEADDDESDGARLMLFAADGIRSLVACVKELEQELGPGRRKVIELEVENAELRGRVDGLERSVTAEKPVEELEAQVKSLKESEVSRSALIEARAVFDLEAEVTG